MGQLAALLRKCPVPAAKATLKETRLQGLVYSVPWRCNRPRAIVQGCPWLRPQRLGGTFPQEGVHEASHLAHEGLYLPDPLAHSGRHHGSATLHPCWLMPPNPLQAPCTSEARRQQRLPRSTEGSRALHGPVLLSGRPAALSVPLITGTGPFWNHASGTGLHTQAAFTRRRVI